MLFPNYNNDSHTHTHTHIYEIANQCSLLNCYRRATIVKCAHWPLTFKSHCRRSVENCWAGNRFVWWSSSSFSTFCTNIILKTATQGWYNFTTTHTHTHTPTHKHSSICHRSWPECCLYRACCCCCCCFNIKW